MKPAKLDLPTIWRGCDWGPVTFKWKDAAGDPIDLRGWLPKVQSLNINLNPVVTEALNGVTTLSLDRVQTANLRLGVESWDWIWEHNTPPFRFPPFLSGKVPIKQPQTPLTGIEVTVPPPPNDNFNDAIQIEGDTGTINGTNVGATRENGEPPGDNSVWYTWTTDHSWTAQAGFGQNLLYIAVYTGDSVDGLTLIAVSQEGDISAVSWPATEGATYHLRIYKKIQVTPFTLHWQLLPPGIPTE